MDAFNQRLRNGHDITSSSTQAYGQAFKIITGSGGNYTIDSIDHGIEKAVTESGKYVRMTIYGDDGSSDPDPTANFGSIDVIQSSLPAACESSRTTFDFSPDISLESNTTYHIVLTYDGTSTGIVQGCYNETGGYTNGYMEWESEGWGYFDLVDSGNDDLDFLITYTEDSAAAGNFTVTITNENTFNVSMTNGTTTENYATTGGSITTNILDNSTSLWNITITANNYFTKEYTNYNVSSDISTTLSQYPLINIYNRWNGSQILTYNATINGTTYTTTNGNIYAPFNSTQNVTYTANNYINRTIEETLTADTTINSTELWQSATTIWASEINTGNLIQNWTLETDQGSNSTTTYNITIYPNLGSYTWNWTNTGKYFNSTGISFTIDETVENLTITNLYARNITFIDSISLTSITPSCTQGSYTYNSTPYYMPVDTTNITCTLTGYQDKEITLNSMPDASQYNMTPVILNLIFTELTEGYVETSDCAALPSSCSYFNATSTYIEQANISTGYVTVKFNPDGSGNWQQIFKYYNDHDTHVKEYVLIETPDLVKTIKVASDGNPLESARVCASALGTNPETSATEWLTTYCEYTNQDGEANLLVNDQNTYKFTVQKTGYVATETILFITPSETTVSKIDLSPIEAEGGSNYIYSTCAPTLNNETTCTINVITGEIYNSICLDYSTNSTSGQSCTSTTTSKSYSYTIDATNTYWELNVSLDGTVERTFTHNLDNSTNYTSDINWELPDQNGQTMLDKLQSDQTLLIVFYIIMTIIGAILGWMAEKYFNGYGVYGTALWFGIIGATGFYLFWIPAAIIVLRGIIQAVIPLVK